MTKTFTAIPFKSLREKRQLAEIDVIKQKTKIEKALNKIIKMKIELNEFKKVFTQAKQNEKDGLKNNVQKTKT